MTQLRVELSLGSPESLRVKQARRSARERVPWLIAVAQDPRRIGKVQACKRKRHCIRYSPAPNPFGVGKSPALPSCSEEQLPCCKDRVGKAQSASQRQNRPLTESDQQRGLGYDKV